MHAIEQFEVLLVGELELFLQLLHVENGCKDQRKGKAEHQYADCVLEDNHHCQRLQVDKAHLDE